MNTNKTWCAMCAKWTDHGSGSCPELAATGGSPRIGFVRENRNDHYMSPMTGYPTGAGVYRYFAINIGRWKFRLGFVPLLKEWHKQLHVVLPARHSRLPGIQVRLWRFAIAFAWENIQAEHRTP